VQAVHDFALSRALDARDDHDRLETPVADTALDSKEPGAQLELGLLELAPAHPVAYLRGFEHGDLQAHRFAIGLVRRTATNGSFSRSEMSTDSNEQRKPGPGPVAHRSERHRIAEVSSFMLLLVRNGKRDHEARLSPRLRESAHVAALGPNDLPRREERPGLGRDPSAGDLEARLE
jgi:hypothetical protein